VGVVDFIKARGLVKFQSQRALGFKTLPILGRLQDLLLPLYFQGNVSLFYKVLSNFTGKNFVTNVYCLLCYKRILLLPIEFVTKYFKEVFDP
jgi:hypothetical protein